MSQLSHATTTLCLRLMQFTISSYVTAPLTLTLVPSSSSHYSTSTFGANTVDSSSLFFYLDKHELPQVAPIIESSSAHIAKGTLLKLYNKHNGVIPVTELMPDYIARDLNSAVCTSPENCFASAIAYNNPKFRRQYVPDVDMYQILSDDYSELPAGATVHVGDLVTFWLPGNYSQHQSRQFKIEDHTWRLLHAGIYLDEHFLFNQVSFLNGEKYRIQTFAGAIKPYLESDPVVRVFRAKVKPPQEKPLIYTN